MQLLVGLAVLHCLSMPAFPAEEWINLTGMDGFAAWKQPHGDWFEAESVALDPENPKLLAAQPHGRGVIVNGSRGRTRNLLTKNNFGDVVLSLEFMLAKGSNSGIKLHGHYEIQLFDSYGKATVTGSDCGAIYPRAEMLPKYRHIDKGVPPLKNACNPPGTWQTLEIVFQAPRFNADGKKTAHAQFVSVKLNGICVQERQELLYPTGHFWQKPEMARGPLLLQADHGPVAFRNVRIRELSPPK